jgi:hypothetical protein
VFYDRRGQATSSPVGNTLTDGPGADHHDVEGRVSTCARHIGPPSPQVAAGGSRDQEEDAAQDHAAGDRG